MKEEPLTSTLVVKRAKTVWAAVVDLLIIAGVLMFVSDRPRIFARVLALENQVSTLSEEVQDMREFLPEIAVVFSETDQYASTKDSK